MVELHPRAGRPRAHLRLPLLRLPDRRRPARADRAGRGRALRRGLRQPARRHRGGARDGVRARDDESGEELRDPRRQRGQRHRRVGRPPAPEELHDEAEVPIIRPSRGTHITLSPDDLPMHAGAIVPAGAGRTIFALPWLGQTLIGTTDNDYEGEIDHVPPGRGRHRVPARRRQRVLPTATSGVADLTGAYAGVRPLISQRRPQEVGRHLAQGRALRDLERDDHDHRRQAHDLAADGQAGGRPARRARRARRALPHARDPAGHGGRRRASCRGSRASRRTPTRSSPAATATRRTRCSTSPASAASWRSRSCPAGPTCWPRSPTRRGASRRAPSGTCCCGAPGSGCWPRASCWTRTERRPRRCSGRRGAGPGAGLGRRPGRARDRRICRAEAGAEGILVSASIGARP